MNGQTFAHGMMLMKEAEDGTGGGGAAPDGTKTAEMKALEEIAKQIEGFKEALGERAKAEDFQNVTKELEKLKEGLETMTSKEVERQIKAINVANEGIYKQIVEMQEELAQKKEEGADGKSVKKQLIPRESVEAFVKSIYPNGKEGDKKKFSDAKIEIKAAETFGAVSFAAGADISAFTGRFVDPTLYQARRKANLILDHFNIQVIDVPTLIYLRKLDIGTGTAPNNTSGGAAWILCGSPKPKRSFRVTTGTVNAKKVAIFGEIEDCLLQDVPSFERWIREDFMDEMNEAINDGLLNNNPGVNALAPLGLKTNSIQYAATPAYDETIVAPNYIDMIFALAALMRFEKEQLWKVFVSSDVYYRIHHLKATDTKYLNNNLVYTDTLGNLWIGGVMVVPVDEEDVASTHVLAVGIDMGFKIYAYGPMVFESGLNGENFREDKTSYRAYQRFLSFIPEERENSVLYDTWANIEAAIAAPAPEEV